MKLLHADCFDWLEAAGAHSVHAIVTDPPFGLLEYRPDQLHKLRSGRGGVWRIPPVLDGCKRKPLPRFTVLSKEDLLGLAAFFEKWGKLALRVLVPGGHLLIASNPLINPYLSWALISAGFERRGEIVRLVRTLRGGDRPKLSEQEFENVSVIPRSCYEPWGLFRKPLSEKRVSFNLKKWGTGGLRRTPDGRPFPDVLKSETPSDAEIDIANHPSLKPQRILRQLVWASLPLGAGVVLDPFMGSGSTIAAAQALGYGSIGIEKDEGFFKLASSAVPRLAKIRVDWESFAGPNGDNGAAKQYSTTALEQAELEFCGR